MKEMRPSRSRLLFSKSTKMKLRSYRKKCTCEVKAVGVKSDKLLALRDSGDFCDKILMSTDQVETKVHRLVMASLSIPFSILMKTTCSITAIGYSKDIINVLIEFAYTGSCSLNESVIVDTLEAANEFKIDELVQVCGVFLLYNLNKRNALSFYNIGIKYCCDHVTSKMFKFICQNFKYYFITTGEALSFTQELISKIVQSEDLQMRGEELKQFFDSWEEMNATSISEEWMDSVSLPRNPVKLVIAIGGDVNRGNSLRATDVMETFNHLTSTWSINTITLPIKNSNPGAVELDGKLYIVGGINDVTNSLDSVYCLNTASMVWQEKSSMISKRGDGAIVVLNGQIFALGGYDGSSYLRAVEMYDPSTNMWTEMPSMRHRRADFGATVFDGKIFAVGGYDGQEILSSIEYFCPKEGMWVDSVRLAVPRHCNTAMVMDDKILVLGGVGGNGILKSVECFQPGFTGAIWYQVPDMLHERYRFASFLQEGKLVVVGGVWRQGDVFDALCGDVEVYCSQERTWSSGPELSIPRGSLACVEIAGFKI